MQIIEVIEVSFSLSINVNNSFGQDVDAKNIERQKQSIEVSILSYHI